MRRVEPYALTLISGWEFAALTTGRLPTITSLVRPLPRLVRGVIAVGFGVYLVRHFEVV